MDTADLVKSAKGYLGQLEEAKKLAQKVHSQQEGNSHGAWRVVDLIRQAESKVRSTVNFLEGESFKELDSLLDRMNRQEKKQKAKDIPTASPVAETRKDKTNAPAGNPGPRRGTSGDGGSASSVPEVPPLPRRAAD